MLPLLLPLQAVQQHFAEAGDARAHVLPQLEACPAVERRGGGGGGRGRTACLLGVDASPVGPAAVPLAEVR